MKKLSCKMPHIYSFAHLFPSSLYTNVFAYTFTGYRWEDYACRFGLRRALLFMETSGVLRPNGLESLSTLSVDESYMWNVYSL